MDIRSQKGYTYSRSNATHRTRRLEMCYQWLLSGALILLALLMLAISGMLLCDSARDLAGAFSSIRDLPHVEILITEPKTPATTVEGFVVDLNQDYCIPQRSQNGEGL